MSVRATSGEHASIEEIAAYLDGCLDGGDRERVTLHLAECNDCYELFAETARFLRDEDRGAATTEANLQPAAEARVLWPAAGRWRRTGWITATFAAAAAGLAALLVWTPAGDFLRADPPTVADLAAMLPPAETVSPVVETSWEGHGWPIRRGARSALGPEEERAFQIGVRIVELEIALTAGNRELAKRLTTDLEGLLDEVDDADPLVVLYGESVGLRGLLEAGAPTADLLDLNRQGDRLLGRDEAKEEHLRFVDAHWYALGRWAAAAHLATTLGDASFVTDRELRRFARREVPDEVERPLHRLAALAADHPERRLPEIERTLAELIAVAGGGQPPE